MTTEVAGVYRGSAPNIAECAALPPEQQKQWLARAALRVCDTFEVEVAALPLIQPDLAHCARVYEAASTRGTGNTLAMQALAELSVMDVPYAASAWRQALTSASTLDRVGHGAYRPYALEALAMTQTNPGRLHDIAVAATQKKSYSLWQQVRGAIGKQQVLAGDLEAAEETRSVITNPDMPAPADEVSLALMEAYFVQGSIVQAWRNFGHLSPTMRPWGVLKLEKYGHANGTLHNKYNLQAAWPQYDSRQQTEIINDLLALGRTTDALFLARQMTLPGYSTLAERRAQTTTIIRIAQHQAATGDCEGGLTTLDTLKYTTERRWNRAIADGLHIPEQSDERVVRAKFQDNQLAQQEYAATINRAAMHALAIRARQSVEFALNGLRQALFYGENAEAAQIYQLEARGVVGAALAGRGAVREAVDLALQANTDDASPALTELQACTLLDIAGAIPEKPARHGDPQPAPAARHLPAAA